MSLFNSEVHRDIWVEHHCHQCWHGTHGDCPILVRALASDRKPVEWERNPRKNVLMQDSIRCNSETRTAPPVQRARVDIDVPMFDVAAPVDMDTEHA